MDLLMARSTKRLVFASDIHFPHHHKKVWQQFLVWQAKNPADCLVVGGDFIDLEMLSTYTPDQKATFDPIKQIRQACRELNKLDAAELVILPGNHEDRWARVIYGPRRNALKDAKGLSLRFQMYEQGLREKYQWYSESAQRVGYVYKANGHEVLCMHGHRSANRYGTNHVGHRNSLKFPYVNTIVGHHHRAQVVWHTTDKPRFHVANPHMSGDHEYAGAQPNWQRGWTEVLLPRVGSPRVVQYVADSKGRILT